MSSLKIKSLVMALAAGSTAIMVSACGANSSDDSLRTPTGYYDHAEAKEGSDPLKVPAGITPPYTDKTFDIPVVSPSEKSRQMIGENMDIRPPVVSQVTESGVDIVRKDENAVVWFLPYNQFNIRDEHLAWSYLTEALKYMKIPVAATNEARYELTTGSSRFNACGEPYDEVSDSVLAESFNQVYQIKVGHAQQGQIGYFIALKSSTSSETAQEPTLVHKANFTSGFANALIKTMSIQNMASEVIPDYVEVVLGRDNNDQDALIVNAGYNSTWNVMRGTLDSYGMKVEEYSISRSTYKVEISEEDPEFYRSQGVEPFGLPEGTYIVRLAVSGDNTVITFYNEDDKPITAAQTARLYPGFSRAITQQFAVYKREGANYLAKFDK